MYNHEIYLYEPVSTKCRKCGLTGLELLNKMNLNLYLSTISLPYIQENVPCLTPEEWIIKGLLE